MSNFPSTNPALLVSIRTSYQLCPWTHDDISLLKSEGSFVHLNCRYPYIESNGEHAQFPSYRLPWNHIIYNCIQPYTTKWISDQDQTSFMTHRWILWTAHSPFASCRMVPLNDVCWFITPSSHMTSKVSSANPIPRNNTKNTPVRNETMFFFLTGIFHLP